jgi:hypothetical protein
MPRPIEHLFEIVVTGPGGLRWEADATDVEGALLAAQTGYDEVYDATVSGREARRAMCVTVLLNGSHVRTVTDGRPQ